MKALEMRSIFSTGTYNASKERKAHIKRMENVVSNIDNTMPNSYIHKHDSGMKKKLARQAVLNKVYKENVQLANRILTIMNRQSSVSEDGTIVVGDPSSPRLQQLAHQKRYIDNHPHTMNYKNRLREAQRIHEDNMILVNRLNNVRPNIRASDLVKLPPSVFLHHKSSKHLIKNTKINRKNPKKKPIKDSYILSSSSILPSLIDHSNLFETQELLLSNINENNNFLVKYQLILEYSKIQNNKTLDIIVVKEIIKEQEKTECPNKENFEVSEDSLCVTRETYYVLGFDSLHNQKYELVFHPDEIRANLEGLIPIISLDHIEVWMILLKKVKLDLVEQYSININLFNGVFNWDEFNLDENAGNNMSELNTTYSLLNLIPEAREMTLDDYMNTYTVDHFESMHMNGLIDALSGYENQDTAKTVSNNDEDVDYLAESFEQNASLVSPIKNISNKSITSNPSLLKNNSSSSNNERYDPLDFFIPHAPSQPVPSSLNNENGNILSPNRSRKLHIASTN